MTTPHPPQHATVAERAALTSGASTWTTTESAGVRSLVLSDGPHGVRRQPEGAGDALGLGTSLPSTCFPPAAGLAASWDPDLVERVGAGLGAEAAALGVDVVLGPGMNIKRSPLGGRNFEYLSEDPYLTGRLAAAAVRGIQSAGVGACVKHFAVNNQETDRMRVDARVDDRTLRETYLRAFEHVVRTADPAMVMSAYNRINGAHAAEDPWLLTSVLRDEWGFRGVVVSDWGAVDDRVAALAAGNDLEMPPTGTDEEIVAAVEDGRLPAAVLDRAVERMRALADRLGPARRIDPAAVERVQAANAVLAREAAARSAVLLSNDGVLPLRGADLTRVALVGALAAQPRIQAGGSSRVVPTEVSDLLGALSERLGAGAVRYAPGYDEHGIAGAEQIEDAVRTARGARVAVVHLGLPETAESEGFDRTDLDLPAGQVELLRRVARVVDRTVVLLTNGGVVDVHPWAGEVDAVLETWLLGQAGGAATADLLLGELAPSGRLAESIPQRLSDHPSALTFPGSDGVSVYGEGTLVGYRGLDALERPVAYPFGHGLTYTTFDYRDLRVERRGAGWDVTITLHNTGERAGTEVVQVYTGAPAGSTPTAPAELRAFQVVPLDAGAARVVTLRLDEDALATWDARSGTWRRRAGEHRVHVGASSRDLRLSTTVPVETDGLARPLDGTSTIEEWRADPAGAPVLAALMERAGLRGRDAHVAPELLRMFLSIPLDKLRSFGLGVSRATVAAMVAEAAENRRSLATDGTDA